MSGADPSQGWPRKRLLRFPRVARFLVSVIWLAACGDRSPAFLDGGLDLQPPDRSPAREALAADLAAVEAGRADSAPPASSPIWILHITDNHLGQGSYASPALELLISEAMPAISPTVTINSGDMTEGGTADQFAAYQAILQGRTPYPSYIDAIGNHDMKADNGNTYLAGSQTGKAGGGFYGLTYLDPPTGRLRVVRTNTADSPTNTIAVWGYVTAAQTNAMLSQPPSDLPVKQTVAIGHHPIKGLQGLELLGTDGRMEAILAHYGASLYFCGHTHTGLLSWLKDTLIVQAPTCGKPAVTAQLGFAVAALDEQGPVARLFSLAPDTPAIGWPLVLVTSPADLKLGGTNPNAKPYAPGATLRVRALAFSPTAIQTVEARLDGGAWASMSLMDRPLWTVDLASPQQAGQHSLEVRASSAEGTGSHGITVTVGS